MMLLALLLRCLPIADDGVSIASPTIGE
ncbi:hypothetical protein F383_05913 [Gossypium arboreum]|uniref:Uncharacterized protein n=1 Tax=Gossypium arboreum TaxID=29729 RepID=A0A0B0P6Q5_GOSAR|nr:hypothetical protein F383_05913 [Gossypium arboreum]